LIFLGRHSRPCKIAVVLMHWNRQTGCHLWMGYGMKSF
jgi:hypothetical protein